MKNIDELFDEKMKNQFKKETRMIPENIDKEFENMLKREKEKFEMGKLKRFGITAASLLIGTTLVMQTASAQSIVDKIVKSLSIKGLTVYENNTVEDIWARDMPEAALGKVFDKDGNVVEKINKDNIDYLYNAEGEHVWVDDDGIILTDQEMEERIKQNEEENADMILKTSDLEELQRSINFKVKYPAYLPEGFEFNYAEYENYEKSGLEASYWYGMEFINKETGEKICLHLTYMVEGYQADTSFDNIKEGKVNGNDAILSNNSISWNDGDINNILFMYDLGEEEGLKIAESIK